MFSQEKCVESGGCSSQGRTIKPSASAGFFRVAGLQKEYDVWWVLPTKSGDVYSNDIGIIRIHMATLHFLNEMIIRFSDFFRQILAENVLRLLNRFDRFLWNPTRINPPWFGSGSILVLQDWTGFQNTARPNGNSTRRT